MSRTPARHRLTGRSALRRYAGPLLASVAASGGLLAVAATTLSGSPAGAATGAGSQLAKPAVMAIGPARSYNFTTLDNPADPTFNQLLGINDSGVVAGYFGSGAAGHPNMGYTLTPYTPTSYVNENFPGATQTQVIGVNNSGTTAGFYADAAGDNFGFVKKGAVWTAVIDPKTTGNMNQLLGLNNYGVAVGFYTDAKGNSHGYEFNFHTGKFSPVQVPGAVSVTATGINRWGEVSGFYTLRGGETLAFVQDHGLTQVFAAPHSKNTMAFGLNNAGDVVGQYVDSHGATHGFVEHAGMLSTVDDPNGVGTTTVNGINGKGQLVGFYTDAAGNTDGFLASPQG